MKKLTLFFNIAFLISGLYFAQLVSAASEMDKGMTLFNKHDYKNALGHFIQEVKKNPTDYNALYYEAVTFHQLKEVAQAKGAYLKIVKTFPGTPAAINANAALMYLDPVYAKQHRQTNTLQGRATSYSDIGTRTRSAQGEAPNGTGSDLAGLPDQARVPYQREGQNLLITAFINGRPIDMFFDSGAEGVVVHKSELESLGLQAPTGQHVGVSYGVGDGGAQKTWLTRVSVKVGQIERKNFPLNVLEDSPGTAISHPLLGQTFFRDFSYTLEPSSDGTRGTILFQKKNPNRSFAANDSSVIPFSNIGKNILVTAEINGHKVPMIFDTGAEMCVFSRRQYESLGLTIPEDAQQGLDAGIAGATTSFRFSVPRICLGPIIKTDVNVSVINDSGTEMPHPLLGNSFFQDLRIDIDNEAHLMRVRR